MNRLLLVPLLCSGCAATMRAVEQPGPMLAAALPVALTEDHFSRDLSGSVSEEHLREILAAPVFLEEGARLGVVPVVVKYGLDEAVPTAVVPAELASALESSGLFEMASEISTEWPTDRGVSGLRELAARYRSEYLLLYRHRFVEDIGHNGWAAGYATVIGALFFPGQQVETHGVLEATLFDVKTGTLLFTVHERVMASESAAPTTVARRALELQRKLLVEGAPKLADRVVEKCRRLVAARPSDTAAHASSAP